VNGSYALGCQVSFLGLQQTTSAVSQEDPAKAWKFDEVYPNPTNANAQMAISAPQAARLAVEVVSVSGVVVSRTYEQANAGKSLIYLNVGKLISGNYLVRIRDEKGVIVHSQTFIKR
jgi:hypothetical protein